MTAADITDGFKRHPVGFVCGLLCVIAGVLIYIRSDTITEKQAEYEAKAAEAEKILANVRNSANLPEQAAEVQALAKTMESRLMHAGQLATNQQYFYKLEAENEVKLLEVRQGGAKNAKALYTGIPYAVSVQGTYKQVLAFLQQLENGRHFCRFLNVSFTKSGGASVQAATAPMTLTLNLELLGQP